MKTKYFCLLPFALCLSGCVTGGGAAKMIKAAMPPKDPGIVDLEISGWNTHIRYHRDTTGRIGSTNGAVTIVPTTTLKVH